MIGRRLEDFVFIQKKKFDSLVIQETVCAYNILCTIRMQGLYTSRYGFFSCLRSFKLVTKTPILWCGYISVKAIASNLAQHAKTKHIAADVHFIRENVIRRELEVSIFLPLDS